MLGGGANNLSHAREFIAIGENLHTTRVLSKKGKRFHVDGGKEYLSYVDSLGSEGELLIPEEAKSGQDYDQGRIKHIKIALQMCMGEFGDEESGVSYLLSVIRRQEQSEADFLDINVDEYSLDQREREDAMEWLAAFVLANSDLPVAIDSSATSVIEVGLAVCARESKPMKSPLLNSASLERLDVLDLAADYGARVIATASGDSGMPTDSSSRLENLARMMNATNDCGIEPSDVFLDPLVFPIAVDGDYGNHVLETITDLRSEYGDSVHITGGFSNVSFGLPERKLINLVFLDLARRAGADSGIIDPVALSAEVQQGLDRDSRSFQLAENVLSGGDRDCSEYLKAWRKKELVSL